MKSWLHVSGALVFSAVVLTALIFDTSRSTSQSETEVETLGQIRWYHIIFLWRHRQPISRYFRRFAYFVLAVVGLASGTYQLLGGPFWPTDLDVEPGIPDCSPTFNVPFSVANKGGLFDAYYTKFYCKILEVITDTGDHVSHDITGVSGYHLIKALDKRDFACYFPYAYKNILKAEIIIGWGYEIQSLHRRRAGEAGPFKWNPRLNPPRWIKGDIMH